MALTRATPEAVSGRIDLAAVAALLWRDRLAIAVVVLGFLTAGEVYLRFLATPVYRSTATLQVNGAAGPTSRLATLIPGLGTDLEDLNTQVILLTSPRFLGGIVDRLDLATHPFFNPERVPPGPVARVMRRVTGEPPVPATREELRETAVAVLTRHLAARNIPNSYVLEVAFESDDPDLSSRIANTIVADYVTYQRDTRAAELKDLTVVLSQTAADLRLAFEAAQSKVNTFDSSVDVVSEVALAGRERQLFRRLDLQAEAERALRLVDDRLAAYGTVTDDTAAAVVSLADDPRLRAIHAQQGRGEAFDRRIAELALQARADRAQRVAKLALITESVTDLQDQVTRLGAELVQLQQLRLDAESSRIHYESALDTLRAASSQQIGLGSQSTIIGDATPAVRPVWPRRSVVLAFAGVLGLIAAAAGTLFHAARHLTFGDAAEVEEFAGISVIGQIPSVAAWRQDAGPRPMATAPTSAVAEAVRNLRTSASFSGGATPQVIVVGSALPSEGKTTVSLMLAASFASTGKRVLLIESDIRRQSLQTDFGVRVQTGLIDVLTGARRLAEAIHRLEAHGIDLLPAERSDAGTVEALHSDALGALIAEARETYDVIVIDTPPILVVTDARAVARHADRLLFLVRSGTTTQRQLHAALRLFETAEIQVDGLVLNDVRHRGRASVYGPGDGVYPRYYGV